MNRRALFALPSSIWVVLASCAVQRRPDLETYREDIRIPSGDAVLAASLLLPRLATARAAIVLLHGSGPDTRGDLREDADWFASQGLAVLFYDKRGAGSSTGDPATASYEDLAADAVAAVDVLRSRSEIDQNRIGIWGPSEGGWVAPIAATRSHEISFVILKSAIAVTPEAQMNFAWTNALRAHGTPEATIAAIDTARQYLWAYVRTGEGAERARVALERSRNMPGFPSDPESVGLAAQVPPREMLESPPIAKKVFFVRRLSRFDPTQFLANMKVPTLAIFGAEDTDVPVTETVKAMKRAFDQSGNRDLEIAVLPGDDHYLERAGPNGSRRTDSAYFRVMRSWLVAHHLLN